MCLCRVAWTHTYANKKSAVNGTEIISRSYKIIIGVTSNGARFPLNVSDRVMYLFMRFIFSYSVKKRVPQKSKLVLSGNVGFC